MLQRLPIALTQVKAGNASENLWNQMHQIVYSLFRENKITARLYNNTVNSIQIQYKMDTIFMNSKKGKISDFHRLLISLSDKIHSNLSIYYIWKNVKK